MRTAIGVCTEWHSTGVPTTEADCPAGAYLGDFAPGPCPTEGRLGRCMSSTGEDLGSLYAPQTDGNAYCSAIMPGVVFVP